VLYSERWGAFFTCGFDPEVIMWSITGGTALMKYGPRASVLAPPPTITPFSFLNAHSRSCVHPQTPLSLLKAVTLTAAISISL
jgi:hypothetical protein